MSEELNLDEDLFLEEPAEVVQTTNTLVSNSLAEQVAELLSGGKIEKIVTEVEYKNSIELLKRVSATRIDLEKERKEKVAPHNEILNEINGNYKVKTQSLEELEKNIKLKGAEWVREQQRIAREKEEAEKARVEAEKKRLAQEAADKLEAEEKLRAQAEAAKTPEESQALHDKANELLNESNKASMAIEEVKQEKVIIPVKVAGKSVKVKWTGRVDNQKNFLKHIVESDLFYLIDGAALTKLLDSAANKLADQVRDTKAVLGITISSVDTL